MLLGLRHLYSPGELWSCRRGKTDRVLRIKIVSQILPMQKYRGHLQRVNGVAKRTHWASKQGKEALVACWAELDAPSQDGFRTAIWKD